MILRTAAQVVFKCRLSNMAPRLLEHVVNGSKRSTRTVDGMKIKDLIAVIKAFAGCRDLERAKQFHIQASETGLDSNMLVATSLIDMYAKCGDMAEARKIFDSMPRKDVVAWNALVFGYVENDESEVALKLFSEDLNLQCDLLPNARSFVAAIMACTDLASKAKSKSKADEDRSRKKRLGWLEKGMAIHAQARKRQCDTDGFVSSALIDMYIKCGSMLDARGVFDGMVNHTVVAWTALLMGYTENGQPRTALDLLDCMEEEEGIAPNARAFVAGAMACTALAAEEDQRSSEKSSNKWCEKGREIHSRVLSRKRCFDIFVASALVEMYSKCGSMQDARTVFDKMPCHNLVAWTALANGYVDNKQAGHAREIIASFSSTMRSTGLSPDAKFLLAALVTSGNTADLQTGTTIHAEIYRHGRETDEVLVASLVDFYGKCGCMASARHLFDSLVVAAAASVVSWNSLVAAYSRQGDADGAIESLHRMRDEGVDPDGVTLVAALAACGRAGLLDRGRRLFQSMRPKLGVEPGVDHYRCLVDLLGRGNAMEEALAVVKGSSLDLDLNLELERDASAWRTILARSRRNVEAAGEAFQCLVELHKDDFAACALMKSVCLTKQPGICFGD